MKPERWERIEQLLESELEEDPGGRPEYLSKACPPDDTLRAEVESMLVRRQAEAEDKEHVMRAVAAAFAKTPANLGESLSSIQNPGSLPADVTTD